MNARVILSLVCSLAFVSGIVAIWRYLRLRLALFRLRQQLLWSRSYAPRQCLVLEVGSGHNPHLRSDVLCDKFLEDDAHRSAGLILDRPLVIADAGALPFRTGSFDVIISQHMIEHLDDPSAFFREAGRVAKRGLFTAPSAVRERLMSDPQHRWFITQRDNHLQFVAKREPIYDPVIQTFVTTELTNGSHRFGNFLVDYWPSLEITYRWEGTPSCDVTGVPSGAGFVQGSTSGPTVTRRAKGVERVRSWLRNATRNVLHILISEHHTVDIERLLACPKCHGDVVISESEVSCFHCKLRFAVRRGIPVMLLEHAVADNCADTRPDAQST